MILFGLSNAPANFQDYINKILAKKFDVFVIIYLNNILIYINKVDYINSVWCVLEQLKKHLLYAKLKKSRLNQEKVQFLSYIVSLQGICIKNKQIEVIYDWFESQSI